ncbi:hypothetical protein C21_00379 [Arenibacter sp. NBRC 103722]|nr:hypothetical protein C21_00379 [Arenibacter sp. NBRC 103722]
MGTEKYGCANFNLLIIYFTYGYLLCIYYTRRRLLVSFWNIFNRRGIFIYGLENIT